MIYIKQKKLTFPFTFFACLSTFLLQASNILYDIISLTEEPGKLRHRLEYIYNQNGFEETKLVYDETGILISTTYFAYNSEGRMISEMDDTGTGFEREYDAAGNLVIEICYKNGHFLKQINFYYDDECRLVDAELIEEKIGKGSQTYWEWMQEMISSAGKSLTSLKENLSYTNYMQHEWTQLAEALIPQRFLQFSGFYYDPVSSGSTHYGEEINDKVRVTLINGMLNIRSDMDTLLKIFSGSHGNVPIHYVFRPTEGWSKDLMTSSLSKIGFASVYAQLLADQWKTLIEEMGGVGNGGKIVHYAHSIGATDTYVARNLLTPEEKQMIHVITMGSPTMIPRDCGFASATNYVSRRDGVCFCLDSVGVGMGYFYEQSHIEFIGTHVGIPLIDHTLYTESYGNMINELGVKFVETYGN